MAIGIGKKIGQGAGFQWVPYWTNRNKVMEASGRNGLTITDSFGNNSSIFLPYLKKIDSAEIIGIADNGALDIGSSDFTYCGWMCHNDVDKSVYHMLGGKDSVTSVNGAYNLYVNITTGYLAARIRTSDNAFSITTTLVAIDLGWFFYRIDVNQTTKKFRLFINGVQQGADKAFTGTFAPMANEYEFLFGCRNGTNGVGTEYHSNISISDTYIFNRLLLDSEELTLRNGGHINGAKVHWTMNNIYGYDATGNGYHFTLKTGISTAQNIAYGAEGSRYLLDYGYSWYRSLAGLSIYVPKKEDGTRLTITPETGYVLSKDAAGTSSNHNLADSLIYVNSANWDRSDTTIFNDLARGSDYDAANPKRWHIEKLIYLNMYDWYNEGHEGKNFPVYNAAFTELTGLLGYSENKTGNGRKYVLQYSGNYDSFHTLSYTFQAATEHIVATRYLKVLKFNHATKVLSLSLDGGVTYSITKNVSADISIICHAQIYANGNILFCNQIKSFYSDDNLSTYQESTVLDIDGNPYVASAGVGKFTTLNHNGLASINGIEVDMWGPYSQDANTAFVDVNIWKTIDGGATIKSIYKFNSSEPVLTAYHVHDVSYIKNNTWIVQTGDNLTHCNWLKLVYDPETDTVTKTSIAVSDETGWYKTVGIAQRNTEIVWGSDSDHYGIYYVDAADIADSSKYKLLYPNNEALFGFFNEDGVYIAVAPIGDMYISTDYGKTWKKHTPVTTGGPTLQETYGGYYQIKKKNSNGYYKAEIIESGENLDDATLGYSMMLKINKG